MNSTLDLPVDSITGGNNERWLYIERYTHSRSCLFRSRTRNAKGVIIEQHTKILYFKIHPKGGLFVGRNILVITQIHSWVHASAPMNKKCCGYVLHVPLFFCLVNKEVQDKMVFWVPNRTQEHMVDA